MPTCNDEGGCGKYFEWRTLDTSDPNWSASDRMSPTGRWLCKGCLPTSRSPSNIQRDEFETLDSGEREEFETGARRDSREGKGRYDLIPVEPLRRWALLMERGAKKYGDRNWEKGMNLSRFIDSAMRHLEQLRDGQTDEDHAAAVLFNVGAYMHTKKEIELGNLPQSLAG